MRSLLLAILVLGIARPAIAQCDHELKIDTHVVAEPEQVASATDLRLDQIAELAKRSGSTQDTAPLGFYTAQVDDKIQVDLDHDVSGACLPHIQVQLHLQLARRRIEIGQELIKTPCLYVAALEHYRRKAAADEAAFAAYVHSIAAALHAAPFVGTAERATGFDDATRTEVVHWVKSVVDQGSQPFHDARVAAQRAVDSQDESRRVSQACGRDA
ncbi:MAG: hypothetical protein ABSE20_02320 [Acetobacteraceae bacterium]|jgi:hypothetical protein